MTLSLLKSDVDIPYYLPTGLECSLFEHAFHARLPLLLKGPTGCGKTRFVAHMAARLRIPLTTVACHDDLTAADLTGRYLLRGGETVWADGPLTRAVRDGGVCYLDEVVEARKDVAVVLHPLTDDRRILPLDRTGETLAAPNDFMLVASYNPGYQSVLKSLKPSTRQRFIVIDFDYPQEEAEVAIVAAESGLAAQRCRPLVLLAQRLRCLAAGGDFVHARRDRSRRIRLTLEKSFDNDRIDRKFRMTVRKIKIGISNGSNFATS